MKVADMMVPLDQYATVPESATMFDAVQALQKAQEEFDQSRYRHRAVLVLDEERNVVGKVSQKDLLTALQPKFEEILETGLLHRKGFNIHVLESVTPLGLSGPLDDLCRKAMERSVRDFMESPLAGEFIGEDASLNEAVRRLITQRHHSLLVTRGKEIVGVLRLSDVFKLVSELVLACED